MRAQVVNCCLRVATLSLLTAVPLLAAAQDEQPAQAQAESAPAVQRLFVSDKLVLNVYAEADQGSSRVATIETGDAVDELERAESLIRVRLHDGREGWVGSSYLTSDAPAALQLRELQRQQKSSGQAVDRKAADEIARLKKESESLQAQVKELKAAASAPPAADDGVLEGPAAEPVQVAAAAPVNSGGNAMMWSLVVVLAAALAYAAGYQTLARRIRKKFGGLRVY